MDTRNSLRLCLSARLLLVASGLSALLAAACSEASTLGTSRTFDDAGGSHRDARGAGGGSGSPNGGGGAAVGGGGGVNEDAGRGGLKGASPDAGSCNSPALNVVQSGGSPLLEGGRESDGPLGTPLEGGAESDAPLRMPIEGGHLVLPTNPCGVQPLPACPSGPRAIFSCPEIRAPHLPTIASGDQITVRVPMSDDGNDNYSCGGIDDEPPLEAASALYYAVKPAYVEVSGRVPSLPSGTLIHFTAVVSGARYPGGGACADDLTRYEFDLRVIAPR